MMSSFPFPRSLQRFARDERGSQTIEFVVTYPLLVGALAIAFEFSQLFIAHHQTENNVRAAVRYLSRTANPADYTTQAENIVRSGNPAGSGAPDWMSTTNATVNVNSAYRTFSEDNFREDGASIRITVTVNYPVSLFGLMNLYNPQNRATVPFTVIEDARHMKF